MKKTTYCVTLLLILSLLIIPAGIVWAQEGDFEEDFESDTSLTDWERSENSVVQEGALQINPGNVAIKIGDYRNFNLSVDLKFSGEGLVILRFNMIEGQDNAVIFFNDRIVIEHVIDGQPTEITSTEWSGFSGEWQTVELTNTSQQISVSVGEEITLATEGGAEVMGGTFGFFAEVDNPVLIDNIKLVTAAVAGEELLPEESPQSEAEVAPAQPTSEPSTLDALLGSLASSQSPTLDLTGFAINLLLSVLLSYILSRVYVHWGSSLSNRRRFASNFILITITTTFIILVVRSSVALSLGLVGALSIVRFRAAIKEPEELAYLFFAIAIGIGLGDNQRLITIVAIAIAILVIAIMRIFRGRQADFNLHLTIASNKPDKVALESISAMLRKHTSQSRLMRFDESPNMVEASYLVEFANSAQFEAAKNALKTLSDDLRITFLDNKGLG